MKKSRNSSVKSCLSFVVVISLMFSSMSSELLAESKSTARYSSEFETPSRLRGRVDFWKAIFSRYGKYQKVIHHRRFPQIAFKVLDFTKAAEELSPGAYDSLVKRIEAEKVAEIEGYLAHLAKTGTPENSMEQYIVSQMRALPGGKQKYQDVLDNDWVRTQTGIKEKCEEAVRRTGRYLPQIERIFVNEESLPVELTRLPFIESSFNYTAYSTVGAAGIWQFMPGTAKKFMMVGSSVDERLDPFTATRAAAQYFKQAYKSLGTWGLAVTSYNHGVAGVYKKTVSSGTNDISEMIERADGDPIFGFASQNFWPEFLAAVEIYKEYRKYYPGVELLPELTVKDHPISKPVTLPVVAKTLGVSTDALIDANYALLKPVILGKRAIPAGYTLRVPTGKVTELVRNDPVYKKSLEKERIQPVTEPLVVKKKPIGAKKKKNQKSTKKSVKSVTKKVEKKKTTAAKKVTAKTTIKSTKKKSDTQK